MSRAISIALLAALIGVIPIMGLAQTQSGPGDQAMRALLVRLGNRSDTFSSNLEAALNRTTPNGADSPDEVRTDAGNMARTIVEFRDRWNRGSATAEDARAVLDQAARVNGDLKHIRLGAQTDNGWSDLRYELDQLASAYNLNWRWDDRLGNNGSGPVVAGTYKPGVAYPQEGLTGTYTIDVSRSDDPRATAEAAVRGSAGTNRQRVLDDLTAQLEAADRLAIERHGQSVTIASSRAPQLTVVADGSVHTEQDQNGNTLQVRTSLNGDQLTISSTGAASSPKSNDYQVTFEPFNNGRSLRVTRRITSTDTYRPVTVQSVYDKTSDIAQLDPNGTNSSGASSNATPSDSYLVRDDVVLMGTLNNGLSTKTARNNDRFSLTVHTPSEFEGAVIEGYVTGIQQSGRVTGRSSMTLNFDTIRLRDGSSYRFAGVVESVRTQGGDEVKVSNEGNVQTSDSRGQTTAKRAAIGTAAGAIIGAIAGGGKGAAIGATVGAGAGAGSVYVQGKDDLDLNNGTEVKLRSSSPRDYSESR